MNVNSPQENQELAEYMTRALHLICAVIPDVTAGKLEKHPHPDDGWEFSFTSGTAVCRVNVFPEEPEEPEEPGEEGE